MEIAVKLKFEGMHKAKRILRVTSLITFCFFICSLIVPDISLASTFDQTTLKQTSAIVSELSLPERLGRVSDSYVPETASKAVIHIQDAHCNYGAQKTISEIISYLDSKYGISVVNMEGGEGEYDLNIFTDIKDRRIRRKVSNHFVKEGVLNGAEYFAVNNPEKVELWGIENSSLYTQNLSVYRDFISQKERVIGHVETLRHILTDLKRHIYKKELLKLDYIEARYNAKKIDLKAYLEQLMIMAADKGIASGKYTNLDILKSTLVVENTIDFKSADAERFELLDRLEKILSKREMERLVIKTLAFKTGRLTQDGFYEYLLQTAVNAGLDLDKYPELKKYTLYIFMYKVVDKITVMEEIDALAGEVKDALFESESERELSALYENLRLLENLFNITLSKDEYNGYIKNKNAFEAKNFVKFIEENANRYGISTVIDDDIHMLDSYRNTFERFFELALKRDEAFVKNIRFTKDDSESTDITLLVTGGFHGETLKELFKKQGIAYFSVMPNFENKSGYKAPYFELLSGNKGTYLQSITSSLSMIMIASLCTKLGIKVEGKEAVKVFRLGVLALRAVFEAKVARVVRVRMRDGRYVVFDIQNDSPVCYVAEHESELPEKFEMLDAKIYEGNTKSLLSLFTEQAIRSTTLTEEEQLLTYSEIKERNDYAYKSDGKEIYYLGNNRYEFGPSGQLVASYIGDEQGRDYRSEMIEISTEQMKLRTAVIELLYAQDVNNSARDRLKGFVDEPDDDHIRWIEELLMLDDFQATKKFKQKIKKGKHLIQRLIRLRNTSPSTIRDVADEREKLIHDVLEAVKDLGEETVNIYISAQNAVGLMGRGKLIADALVHASETIKVNIIVWDGRIEPDGFKFEDKRDSRITFICPEDKRQKASYAKLAKVHIGVSHDVDEAAEGDIVFKLFPIGNVQGQKWDELWYLKSRANNDLEDPYGTVFLDRDLYERRKQKDLWDNKRLAFERRTWLSRACDPRQVGSLDRLAKEKGTRKKAWHPERAIWTWGYFQDATNFKKELKRMVTAFSGENIKHIPFADGGKQLVMHLVAGKGRTHHSIDYWIPKTLRKRINVIDKNGDLISPEGSKVPITIVLHDSIDNKDMKTLQSELSGTAVKTDDQKMWIDFPVLVTGSASWLEAISAGAIWLHDGYDVRRDNKRGIVVSTVIRKYALEDSEGTLSWQELKEKAEDEADKYMMGAEGHESLYADLEGWTRGAREYTDMMYKFNMVDDILQAVVDTSPVKTESDQTTNLIGKVYTNPHQRGNPVHEITIKWRKDTIYLQGKRNKALYDKYGDKVKGIKLTSKVPMERKAKAIAFLEKIIKEAECSNFDRDMASRIVEYLKEFDIFTIESNKHNILGVTDVNRKAILLNEEFVTPLAIFHEAGEAYFAEMQLTAPGVAPHMYLRGAGRTERQSNPKGFRRGLQDRIFGEDLNNDFSEYITDIVDRTDRDEDMKNFIKTRTREKHHDFVYGHDLKPGDISYLLDHIKYHGDSEIRKRIADPEQGASEVEKLFENKRFYIQNNRRGTCSGKCWYCYACKGGSPLVQMDQGLPVLDQGDVRPALDESVSPEEGAAIVDAAIKVGFDEIQLNGEDTLDDRETFWAIVDVCKDRPIDFTFFTNGFPLMTKRGEAAKFFSELKRRLGKVNKVSLTLSWDIESVERAKKFTRFKGDEDAVYRGMAEIVDAYRQMFPRDKKLIETEQKYGLSIDAHDLDAGSFKQQQKKYDKFHERLCTLLREEFGYDDYQYAFMDFGWLKLLSPNAVLNAVEKGRIYRQFTVEELFRKMAEDPDTKCNYSPFYNMTTGQLGTCIRRREYLSMRTTPDNLVENLLKPFSHPRSRHLFFDDDGDDEKMREKALRKQLAFALILDPSLKDEKQVSFEEVEYRMFTDEELMTKVELMFLLDDILFYRQSGQEELFRLENIPLELIEPLLSDELIRAIFKYYSDYYLGEGMPNIIKELLGTYGSRPAQARNGVRNFIKKRILRIMNKRGVLTSEDLLPAPQGFTNTTIEAPGKVTLPDITDYGYGDLSAKLKEWLTGNKEDDRKKGFDLFGTMLTDGYSFVRMKDTIDELFVQNRHKYTRHEQILIIELIEEWGMADLEEEANGELFFDIMKNYIMDHSLPRYVRHRALTAAIAVGDKVFLDGEELDSFIGEGDPYIKVCDAEISFAKELYRDKEYILSITGKRDLLKIKLFRKWVQHGVIGIKTAYTGVADISIHEEILGDYLDELELWGIYTKPFFDKLKSLMELDAEPGSPEVRDRLSAVEILGKNRRGRQAIWQLIRATEKDGAKKIDARYYMELLRILVQGKESRDQAVKRICEIPIQVFEQKDVFLQVAQMRSEKILNYHDDPRAEIMVKCLDNLGGGDYYLEALDAYYASVGSGMLILWLGKPFLEALQLRQAYKTTISFEPKVDGQTIQAVATVNFRPVERDIIITIGDTENSDSYLWINMERRDNPRIYAINDKAGYFSMIFGESYFGKWLGTASDKARALERHSEIEDYIRSLADVRRLEQDSEQRTVVAETFTDRIPYEPLIGEGQYFISEDRFALAANNVSDGCVIMAYDKRGRKQYLGHVTPRVPVKAIIESFEGINLENSEIYILPGMKQSSAMANTLRALKAAGVGKKVKFVKLGDTDAELPGIIFKNGKLFLAGKNLIMKDLPALGYRTRKQRKRVSKNIDAKIWKKSDKKQIPPAVVTPHDPRWLGMLWGSVWFLTGQYGFPPPPGMRGYQIINVQGTVKTSSDTTKLIPEWSNASVQLDKMKDIGRDDYIYATVCDVMRIPGEDRERKAYTYRVILAKKKVLEKSIRQGGILNTGNAFNADDITGNQEPDILFGMQFSVDENRDAKIDFSVCHQSLEDRARRINEIALTDLVKLLRVQLPGQTLTITARDKDEYAFLMRIAKHPEYGIKLVETEDEEAESMALKFIMPGESFPLVDIVDHESYREFAGLKWSDLIGKITVNGEHIKGPFISRVVDGRLILSHEGKDLLDVDLRDEEIDGEHLDTLLADIRGGVNNGLSDATEAEKLLAEMIIGRLGRVKKIVALEDHYEDNLKIGVKGSVKGLFDRQNGILYLNHRLLEAHSKDRMAEIGPQIFHELGEGLLEGKIEITIAGQHYFVRRHTLLRGCGKDIRRIFDKEDNRGLTADEMITRIKAVLPRERWNDDEFQLIRLNEAEGRTGERLIIGLQDTLFGKEANEALTAKIELISRYAADTEVLKDVYETVGSDWRQNVVDYIINPVHENAEAQHASIASKTDRKLDRKYGADTIVKGYAYSAELCADRPLKVIDNIRKQMLGVMETMAEAEGQEKEQRGVVFVPENLFSGANRREVLDILFNSDEMKVYEEKFKSRFVIQKLGNIHEDGFTDEITHIVWAKGVLNYARRLESDISNGDLYTIAGSLVHLLASFVENIDEIIDECGQDPTAIIQHVLEGLVILRIRKINWGSIREWKEQQEQVLRAL